MYLESLISDSASLKEAIGKILLTFLLQRLAAARIDKGSTLQRYVSSGYRESCINCKAVCKRSRLVHEFGCLSLIA
jgi:hypothetical protein